jgi:hypothetical protein
MSLSHMPYPWHPSSTHSEISSRRQFPGSGPRTSTRCSGRPRSSCPTAWRRGSCLGASMVLGTCCFRSTAHAPKCQTAPPTPCTVPLGGQSAWWGPGSPTLFSLLADKDLVTINNTRLVCLSWQFRTMYIPGKLLAGQRPCPGMVCATSRTMNGGGGVQSVRCLRSPGG